MATTLALIEGFDTYGSGAQLNALAGVAFTSSGWAMTQTPRLTGGYSIKGPSNTSAPLVYDADRLTTTSVTDTYFLMCGIKPLLTSAQRRFRFMDSSDVAHVDIEISATGEFKVKNGDGTLLATSAAGLVLSDEWGTLEIKVTISDASGIVGIKWNGVQVVNLTSADTQNGGTAEVAKIEFTPDGYLDDVVGFIGATSDGFPGPRKVVVKRPATDGSIQFARNGGSINATQVDDLTPDSDITYNSSSTATEQDLFNMATVTESGAIDGVREILVAKKTDIGTRRMQTVQDDGVSAQVKSADEKELTTDYKAFDNMTTAKPAGGAWSAGDVNGCDFGYELST